VGTPDVCAIQWFCKLLGVLAEAEQRQMDYLNSVTLEDVLPRPAPPLRSTLGRIRERTAHTAWLRLGESVLFACGATGWTSKPKMRRVSGWLTLWRGRIKLESMALGDRLVKRKQQTTCGKT